jgi:cytochrome c oxidase assembly factor CtaG/ferredoxin
MNSVAEALLKSWTLDPALLFLLALTGLVYGHGWLKLRRQMPGRLSAARLLAFFAGLASVFLAVCSPLDAFANLLLTAHMIQHLLLMMAAPPLLLLGNPFLPLLRGLPTSVSKHGLGPFLAWKSLASFGRRLTHPVVCWAAFISVTIAWHLPPMYELALRSQTLHAVEHVCFLATGLLFWWPVIQPWPSRAQWPRWSMIPYLFLADFQNTALSAYLIFCDRVVYPTYAAAPRLPGMSALEDQAAAGAIMWVPGSLVFLIAVGVISVQALSSRRRAVRPSSLKLALPVLNHSIKPTPRPASQLAAPRRTRFDLLSMPFIGVMIRWRYFRRAAQTVMLMLALVTIADGLFGHQMSSMNLAGVLPWTHWRGLSVLALLFVGNFFCMACPFTLIRDLGRRFLPARWRWPRQLRSKWLAVGLLAVYLWAYEAFSLWDSPWLTAWIIIGYFTASFVVDGLFKGASFCKYVCPIGQFNFIQSLVSPLEVKARNLDVCRTCTTHECIRGSSAQRGCELQLFVPRKSGNMDCTLCLDCIHACPHQNIGLISISPARQLIPDRARPLIGRLARRPSVAALALLLVFGAFVNAAGMIAPVTEWEERLQNQFGSSSPLPVITVVFAFGLFIAPAILAVFCGTLSKALGGIPVQWKKLTCSFVMALVPLGFSMWVAHFVYHLLIGASAIVPTFKRAAGDAGISFLGRPDWASVSTMVPVDWLTSIQVLLLGAGLLLTLYVGWRTAFSFTKQNRSAFGLLLPWATLAVALYAAGVWVVFQPMQMRGMMHSMMQ